MNKVKVGFALCGSFCTISSALTQMKHLVQNNYDVYPILSPIVYSANTRFSIAEELRKEIETLTGKKIIHTIEEAEPIGPKKMFDVLAVCPCTGNTLAKLAYGITDTSVTMAVKAHIRNNRPVVLAIASNDALGATAKNIGFILNTRNYYFVPFSQDDPINKERSIIADFGLLEETIISAMDSKQLQPVIK
ncbi:MAG: dipicolinate synthase subunit B [Ruminococcaceae bacterium]|nr:dipicolinate synthase subunit B [Oscillospiraceae bacterium]